jgi:hypothetical protein
MLHLTCLRKVARVHERCAASRIGCVLCVRSGNWACPHCGNVNFASRLTCNMRICGAARPSRHAAAPQQGTGDAKGLAERLMRCARRRRGCAAQPAAGS